MSPNRMLVAQAAMMGGRWPDSPSVGNTVEQKIMPAQRNMAMATPPLTPRLFRTMPSGAASRMMMRQMKGCAIL